MPNKRGVKYNSKSVLTLKSYTPEEIQKFLNSGCDSLASIGRVKLEAPNCYFPYGVIYISKVEALKKYKTFYQQNMDFYLIENWQCREVDDLEDFVCVEAIMKTKI